MFGECLGECLVEYLKIFGRIFGECLGEYLEIIGEYWRMSGGIRQPLLENTWGWVENIWRISENTGEYPFGIRQPGAGE